VAEAQVNYEDDFTVEDEDSSPIARLEARDKKGIATLSPENLYKVAAYTGMLVPSAGFADYAGQYPNPEKSGSFLPSFDENVNKGEYFNAAMQFLGAAGDATYTIPGIGAFTGTALKSLALGGKLSKVQLSKLMDGIGAYMTKTDDPMLAMAGGPNLNIGSSITKMEGSPSGGSKVPDDLNLGSGSLFNSNTKQGRKLLIVSCSADKCPDPGDMEAFDRYTGDMYKTIKKAGVPEENVDLAIMSAKYGLIRRDTQIPTYNVKMDKEIAGNLLKDPAQVNRIRNTITGYDEVVVEGSDLYKSVVKEAAGDIPLRDFKVDFKKAVELGEVKPDGGYGSGRQKQSVGNFLRSNKPVDVFHYSSNPEISVFNSDKAPSVTDALGTHVGTSKAAATRYDELSMQDPFLLGATYPLKANLSKPFLPKSEGVVGEGLVWSEKGLDYLLLDEFNKKLFKDDYAKHFDFKHLSAEPGYENFPFSDFRKFVGDFRRKLAADGYTHIPYYNEVEDYGSTSFVMLTDRPKDSAAVLKGKFGKNDPTQRTNPDIMKEDGGVISLKDKAVNMNRGPRGIEPYIQYMEDGGEAQNTEETMPPELQGAYAELSQELIQDPRTGEFRYRTEEEILQMLGQFQSQDFLQDVASGGFQLRPSVQGGGSVTNKKSFMGTLDGEAMNNDIRVNQGGGRLGFEAVAPNKDQFGAGVSVYGSKGRVKNPEELEQFGVDRVQKFGSNKVNVGGIDAYYNMMNALTKGDSVRAGVNYNPNSEETNYNVNYNVPVKDLGIPALTQGAVNMYRRMVR
jgi:hypothetical protein